MANLEYYITLFFLLSIPFIYFRVIKNKNWEYTIKKLLPFNKKLKIEIKGALKLFLLLLIGSICLITIINFVENTSGIKINDLDKVENFINQGLDESIIGFILTIIIVLFIEELFFRSFLIKKIGVFASTILFTIVHLGYESISQVIGVFFLGLILAYWFKKNNSIIQNYLGHLFYDFLAIALYFLI